MDLIKSHNFRQLRNIFGLVSKNIIWLQISVLSIGFEKWAVFWLGHVGHLIGQQGSRQKQEGLNSHNFFHNHLIQAAKNDLFQNVWSLFLAWEMLVFIMSLWKPLTELAESDLLIPQDSAKKSLTQSMLFLVAFDKLHF